MVVVRIMRVRVVGRIMREIRIMRVRVVRSMMRGVDRVRVGAGVVALLLARLVPAAGGGVGMRRGGRGNGGVAVVVV
ncbi:MAG: hypothetical protein ACJ8J0_21325, partial [Longimicrobiaceae bacterium]